MQPALAPRLSPSFSSTMSLPQVSRQATFITQIRLSRASSLLLPLPQMGGCILRSCLFLFFLLWPLYGSATTDLAYSFCIIAIPYQTSNHARLTIWSNRTIHPPSRVSKPQSSMTCHPGPTGPPHCQYEQDPPLSPMTPVIYRYNTAQAFALASLTQLPFWFSFLSRMLVFRLWPSSEPFIYYTPPIIAPS